MLGKFNRQLLGVQAGPTKVVIRHSGAHVFENLNEFGFDAVLFPFTSQYECSSPGSDKYTLCKL
jgi:hypothetical protein